MAKNIDTCPANRKGPGRSRVEFANSATHQAGVLLSEAVACVAQLEDESYFVLRALVVRARRLTDAATVLLSLDALPGNEEDAQSLEDAEHEVTHG